MNHGLADLPGSVSRLAALAESAGRTDPIEITVPGDVATPG
jgi:hypothetical protein